MAAILWYTGYMTVEPDTSTLRTPLPFRPTEDQHTGIERLHKVSGLPRALIVRKLVGFALPKFLRGEAQLVPDMKAGAQPAKGGKRG